MSKTSTISSLAELQERKAELKEQQENAKAGLAKSLQRTPSTVSRFAYEDLALPVMGLGLMAYIGYRVFRKKSPAVAPVPPALPSAAPVAQAHEPAPAPLPARRPSAATPMPKNTSADKGFDLKSILSAGRILVPAAQAIYTVMKSQQDGGQMEVTKKDLPEGVEA